MSALSLRSSVVIRGWEEETMKTFIDEVVVAEAELTVRSLSLIWSAGCQAARSIESGERASSRDDPGEDSTP